LHQTKVIVNRLVNDEIPQGAARERLAYGIPQVNHAVNSNRRLVQSALTVKGTDSCRCQGGWEYRRPKTGVCTMAAVNIDITDGI
jgi:hypothetical protein